MKTPFCYIVYIGYEDFVIKKTLKQTILARRANYDNALDSWNNSNIDIQFSDDSKEKVDLRPYILEIIVSEENKKEIESQVDKEIEKNEKMIQEMMGNGTGMITGWFGITKRNREWAIENEIKNASYVWDEEKINSLEDLI